MRDLPILQKIRSWGGIVLCILSLTACSSNNDQAPVVEGWKQPVAQTGGYVVQEGDSLYSIAWAFGMDYHDLAHYNQLLEPYNLSVGQRLSMSAKAVTVSTADTAAGVQVYPAAIPTTITANADKPVLTPNTAQSTPTATTRSAVANPTQTTPHVITAAQPELVSTHKTWSWPTKGSVVKHFDTQSGGNHGLDIGGKLGQPILAAAAGKVVYAGSGMPGYGNLIIIKHNDTELSAYGFNQKLLVKEGETVKLGQIIANMGKDATGTAVLHFEIRRNGKPVDPLNYLS